MRCNTINDNLEELTNYARSDKRVRFIHENLKTKKLIQSQIRNEGRWSWPQSNNCEITGTVLVNGAQNFCIKFWRRHGNWFSFKDFKRVCANDILSFHNELKC